MKAGTPQQPEFAGRRAEVVDRLLHGVADIDQRLHLRSARILAPTCDSTLPIWVWPPRQSIFSISAPSRSGCATQPRCPAFGKPAKIDELHIEPADRRRLLRTSRPAAGRPYPRSAGGSWWRRAQRPAARAGPATPTTASRAPWRERRRSPAARKPVGRPSRSGPRFLTFLAHALVPANRAGISL